MEIFGHQKTVSYLEKSFEKGRLAHAYLFSGPKNLGKRSLAEHLAGKITRFSPLAHGINPDLEMVRPETEERKGFLKIGKIKIDQIRELEHFLSLSAGSSGWKTAIIDDAERMTLSSQNALLKTLEEPPTGAVVILVAHDEKKIIPTVRSRCVRRKFYPLSDSEMMEIGEKIGLSPQEIFWAGGRPGLILGRSDLESNQEKRKKFISFLRQATEGNLSEKFSLAEELAKDPASALEIFDFWKILFRRAILGKDAPGGLSASRALGLFQKVDEGRALLEETNSNPRSVLEGVFLKF